MHLLSLSEVYTKLGRGLPSGRISCFVRRVGGTAVKRNGVVLVLVWNAWNRKGGTRETVFLFLFSFDAVDEMPA